MRVSTARRAVASTSSAFHNARSATNATVNAFVSMVAERGS